MPQPTYDTYLAEDVTFPFCRGCGHTHAVRHLDKALVKLQREPSTVNLVSDIGCIGLVDSLFSEIHTVHTTHGRSTAFGTGIELADSILCDSSLKTIVILGDGGATIGLPHIVNASLMNVDLTVLVCNNFLYGMTGGQQSGFTPLGMATRTSPSGAIVPPMDICRIMERCEAGFVARTLATDRELPELLAQAIDYPGFALVEILELCPQHGSRRGGMDGKRLKSVIRDQNVQTGVLVHRSDRQEFALHYRALNDGYTEAEPAGQRDRTIVRDLSSPLSAAAGIVMAGTAGERVQSAAHLLIRAAVRSGLRATQKNDNPVTQGAGFSLSEVVVSPTEIYYTGIDVPQYVIVTSEDGLYEILANGIADRCSDETIVFVDSSLKYTAEIRGIVHRLPFRSTFGPESAALGAAGILVRNSRIVPLEAYEREVKERFGNDARRLLAGLAEMNQV
jgi:2-oxoglutarate/2-oxoacid ferredoxin oxidoreductase subunit beta